MSDLILFDVTCPKKSRDGEKTYWNPVGTIGIYDGESGWLELNMFGEQFKIFRRKDRNERGTQQASVARQTSSVSDDTPF